ncbi:MAG: hypothetical protein WC370_11335 [Dehalococcoidales bacterium]|jgi:hypothetical protein
MNILQDIEIIARKSSAGTERLFITMGGTTCAVISQDSAFLGKLHERFGSAEPPGKVDYEIILTPAPHREFAADEDRRSGRPSINRVKSGSNYIIKQDDSPFLAIVNTLSRKVLVKMLPEPDSFSGFLRMLFTLILADEKALLLNASAVSENGQGRVFFGPSGCGKTTAARLAPEHGIIADDLAIIKPHHGGYRVCGTPFRGDSNESHDNARAELSGLYLLKKDGENRISAMDSTRAAAELYHNVLFFTDDNKLLNRVFRICRDLANKIPVYELHFQPGPSFWELVKKQS